jgi:hypothetical protein
MRRTLNRTDHRIDVHVDTGEGWQLANEANAFPVPAFTTDCSPATRWSPATRCCGMPGRNCCPRCSTTTKA